MGFSEPKTCRDITTGTFKLVSPISGTSIIIRTATEQIEINKENNVVSKYQVNWLNYCCYQLYNQQIIDGPTYLQASSTDTITVRIVNMTNDSVFVDLSSNFSDTRYQTGMAILE
jgi:hypothetical protein